MAREGVERVMMMELGGRGRGEGGDSGGSEEVRVEVPYVIKAIITSMCKVFWKVVGAKRLAQHTATCIQHQFTKKNSSHNQKLKWRHQPCVIASGPPRLGATEGRVGASVMARTPLEMSRLCCAVSPPDVSWKMWGFSRASEAYRWLLHSS